MRQPQNISIFIFKPRLPFILQSNRPQRKNANFALWAGTNR